MQVFFKLNYEMNKIKLSNNFRYLNILKKTKNPKILSFY